MTFCYVLKSGMQIDCAHAIQLYLHMLLPPIHVDKIVQAYSCVCIHLTCKHCHMLVGAFGASQQ